MSKARSWNPLNRLSRRRLAQTAAGALAMTTLPGRRPGAAQAAQEATPEGAHAALTPAEAQTIAEEAFIYGFPMVEGYKTMYAYAIDQGGPEYKAPFNEVYNTARVFTPEDTAVVSPNSDTPYSFLWLDLRAEPVVLTVPPVETERYFSWQTADLYTYILPYIGSRTTGNGGGTFLFTGLSWTGTAPDGIDLVLTSPTDFALSGGRTQLFGPDDLDNVIEIQSGYKAEPLSAHLGEPAPPAAPAIDWPLYDDARAEGLGFFDYLAFLLQFAPILPEDQEIRERIGRLGVVPGEPFHADALSPEMQDALLAGITAANELIELEIQALTNANEIFGSREFLRGRYLDRAAGARYGIYGNAKEEAVYVTYNVDADGNPLDGKEHAYSLRFPPGELPPVNAFWSVTVYDRATQLLVANPIDRYLINSPMLPGLNEDADGGLTIDLQYDEPGPDREANWLPLPDGPFYASLRMYWPQEAALNGTWQAPAITTTK